MRILLVAALVVGCKHKAEQPPVDPTFDAFEKKWVAESDMLIERATKEGKQVTDADRKGLEAYHGVFIGKTGVFIDRTRVATLDELKTKRDQLRSAIDHNIAFMPTVRVDPMVVLDLGDQPASVAIDALELFVGKKISIDGPGEAPHATQELCAGNNLRDTPQPPTQQNLSVLLTAKSVWIGVSGIKEFQELPAKGTQPDLDQLKTTLLEHKSADFKDRYDIELAADGGSAGDVLDALHIVCDEFTDIAILPRDRLSANPVL